MDSNELDLNLAETVVKRAIVSGADEAEVLLVQGYESGVRLRKGTVELLSEAQPRSMSLRLYKDKRAAVVYTSDFTGPALEKLVEQALDLATIADPDPYSGLPDPADLATNFEADLGLWDPSVGDLPTEVKVELIRRSEEAAFAFDPRINNTNGSSFYTRLSQVGLVNSLGFAGSYKVSNCSLSTDALASDGASKNQAGWWSTRSHNFKGLKKPEEIGRLAAQRAVSKIGGRKVVTRKVPIIWEKEMASGLLGVLSGAINGGAFERRATFLLSSEGQKVGSDLVTIIDDPLRPGLPGSRPFDGEGVGVRRHSIFTQGVFERFLFNSYYARKTGRKTTGSAYGSIGSLPGVGTSNFYLEPGTTTPEELIAGVDEGLYLTEMIGFGFNPVTGDFSRGAIGMWIEKGQLTYPVAEINIAGNMADMLANITQLGNDLEFEYSVAAPTLRIDGMTVSGL
jgi:PmbA protein